MFHSWIGRLAPAGPGMRLHTPGASTMIDDGHIRALRADGAPQGDWTLVDPASIDLRRDLAFWGIEIERLLLANFERMKNWHACRPGLAEIIRQAREIREDVTVAGYSHHDEGHAADVWDGEFVGANAVAGMDDDEIRSIFAAPGIYPIIHPEFGVDLARKNLRRLSECGVQTVMVWQVATFGGYDLASILHDQLRREWLSESK